MSGFRDITKGGWHPKGKDGKSTESWRGDFKGIGQVAGWMGKGKNTSTETSEHVAKPLSTLKDPAAFGPPPKHINYHGGAAVPNRITPDTRGLGAPLSREDVLAKQQTAAEPLPKGGEDAIAIRSSPVPYRVDTTGLSVSHLPPPPGRSEGSSVSQNSSAKPKPPSLPPRLPPRSSSTSVNSPSSNLGDPAAHGEVLNQRALTRLGAAGVSVPGFDIGTRRQPAQSPLAPEAPSQNMGETSSVANASQLSRFESRSSRLSPKSSISEHSGGGTTFAQKQAMLRTAASLNRDPASVSLGDAKAAASTANNFRERHGEQLKSGWQSANNLDTRHGITGRMSSIEVMPQSDVTTPSNKQADLLRSSGLVDVLSKKKPPPPLPPPKRADLLAPRSSATVSQPPVPISTRPGGTSKNNYG